MGRWLSGGKEYTEDFFWVNFKVMMFCIETYYDVFFPEIIIYWNVLETYFMTQIRYTEQLGTYFPVVLHVRLAMCVICCFIM